MNLAELVENFSTEESAIRYLESQLWPEGPVCPHCGEIGNAFEMRSKAETKNKMRPGLWKCSGCRKTFRVTVGTIFEDSHIPLHKWMMAIHLMCASKKGISAHQLHRMLGIGYRAAWFMAHRIRHAMSEKHSGKLSGTIEVDETYVGGKVRVGSQANKPGERPRDKRYHLENKVPVVSLVQRNGRVRSFQMERVTAKNLRPVLREHISRDSRINTDESRLYGFAKKDFFGHDVVNHSKDEYSRVEPDGRLSSTNTVEGYFSILKRGVYGTFHHVGKGHLHRYLCEFDFRYNSREVTDGERALQALRGFRGKRLAYRTRIAR